MQLPIQTLELIEQFTIDMLSHYYLHQTSQRTLYIQSFCSLNSWHMCIYFANSKLPVPSLFFKKHTEFFVIIDITLLYSILNT